MLISDYNMPKMNGCELHREVNMLAPGVEAIIISGRDVQYLTGNLHFLQKPFAAEHLLRLIKAVKGD